MKMFTFALFFVFSSSVFAKGPACAGSGGIEKSRPLLSGERIVKEKGDFEHVDALVEKIVEGNFFNKAFDWTGFWRFWQKQGLRSQIRIFLNEVDHLMKVAFRPEGPFMFDGPLGRNGPNGNRAHSPNTLWEGLVRLGIWRTLPDSMRAFFEFGPTSYWGPAGKNGGLFDMARSRALIPKFFSSSRARIFSREGRLRPAFAVEDVVDGFVYEVVNPRDQIVSVGVTPTGSRKNHFVEVFDAEGNSLGKSENDRSKNVVVFEGKAGETFRVVVRGEPGQMYRLRVLGAGRTVAELRQSKAFGWMFEFYGERRALRMLVIFGPFGMLGPLSGLGPVGPMGSVFAKLAQKNWVLHEDGRITDGEFGPEVHWIELF